VNGYLSRLTPLGQLYRVNPEGAPFDQLTIAAACNQGVATEGSDRTERPAAGGGAPDSRQRRAGSFQMTYY